MSKLSVCLKHSFQVFHSFLLPVFMAFLLDPTIFVVFFQKTFIESIWIWPIFLLFFVLKMYFLAGIFGIYLDLSVRKSCTFHFKNFHEYASQNWLTSFIFITFPVAVHLFFFILIKGVPISPFQMSVVFNLALCFWLAKVFINKYLIKPFALSPRPLTINRQNFLFLFVLFVAHLNIFYLSQKNSAGFFDWPRISILLFQYVSFLSFIYFIHLMIQNYPQVKSNPSKKVLVLINPLGPAIVEGLASVIMRWVNPPLFTVLRSLTPKDYEIREFNRVFW